MERRRPRRWLVGIVGCTASISMLLAACGSSGSSKPSTGANPPAAETPKRGGTLTLGEFNPLSSMDPAKVPFNGEVAAEDLAAIYGVLIRYNPDTNQYEGAMAQSLTPSADFKTWTLKLRPNVMFTDGTPFDANAVAVNLKRHLNPAVHSVAAGPLQSIADVATPDAMTVVFTLKQPWSGFQYAIVRGGLIAAPSYLAQVDAGNANATPVGAGPFKYQSFRPNEEVTLVRNDGYWDGAPYLDQLHFVYIAGGTATLQAFQTGQTQVAIINNPQAAAAAVMANIAHFTNHIDMGSVLMFNDRPPGPNGSGSVMSDVRLREAVSEAIDPKVINNRVYQDSAVTTSNIFPPSSAWTDPSIKGVQYNPDHAKQLVAQVKAETGWDGTVRFEYQTSPDAAALPVALQSMLEPVGFKLQLITDTTSAQHLNDVKVKQAYDIASWGFAFSDTVPFSTLNDNFYSTSISNVPGYKNPDMDAALDAMRVAGNQNDMKAAIQKMQQVWYSTYPALDLNAIEELIVYQPNVHGLSRTLFSVPLFDKAWLS
jgi:peptide/nickel transport system substrate-binding protein